MPPQFEGKSCCAELYSAGFIMISTELVNCIHFNMFIHFFEDI